jgi:hypothetical protein
MIENPVIKKRVLFIAPGFYNYENELKLEMERQNYIVDLVPYSYATHLLPWKIRILKKKINKERARIIQLINNEYFDIFFVIKGEILDKDIINEFKTRNPKAITINYQWDSIANLENFNFDTDLIKYYDFKYSFDHLDCIKYKHWNLQHKPLFYTEEFKVDEECEALYDFATVGGMQMKRVNLVKQLQQILPDYRFNIHLRTSITLNLPFTLIKTGIKPFFQFALLKDLNKKEVSDILKKAKVIIDAPQLFQSGLSMRTIEVLALGRKLITINPEVQKYDFYNPINCYILNGFDHLSIKEFLDSPVERVDEEITNKYSISFFVSSILQNRAVTYLKQDENNFHN